MFVGVVALRYMVFMMECHDSHRHSQSPLTNVGPTAVCMYIEFDTDLNILYMNRSQQTEIYEGCQLNKVQPIFCSRHFIVVAS